MIKDDSLGNNLDELIDSLTKNLNKLQALGDCDTMMVSNISSILDELSMTKRQEYLEKHPYKIWQSNNGNWYTYLPDPEKGRALKKRKTKENLEDDIVAYWKEELENPTFREVFEEWNDRRLNLKKISPSTHLRNKQLFNRHYETFGEKKIKTTEAEEILDFLEEQIPKHNLTAKAFSNLKTITRGFLKRARKRKLIFYDVESTLNELDTSETDFKKVVKEDYEEVFSEEELPIILDYLENHKDLKNIGILLMFISGIRLGELVTLKHSDFTGLSFKIYRTETRYRDENEKYVYAVKESKTEAGLRTAIIPKHYEWILEFLQKSNPNGEYIFTNASGERMKGFPIRERMYRICNKLNMSPKSPHKARKTYGSILLDNGLDKRLITSVMGHTDITCTETHYHRNRKSIDRKVEIISSIPEFSSIDY